MGEGRTHKLIVSSLCEEIKKQPEFKNNPTARIDRDPQSLKNISLIFLQKIHILTRKQKF